MQLPAPARRLIEEHAETVGFAALKRASAALSDAYREGKPTRMRTDEDVAAYLATRMPATYAAARAALEDLPDLPVHSVLDIGAGPGAASLAARERFAGIAESTLVERDPSLADAAREFLPEARVLASDATAMAEFPPHDLVIAAYSLGEIDTAIATRLWQAARILLVVLEPGTPRGFAKIAALRAELLALGAQLAAPCPGPIPCPMSAPDWCHFAARVERSSLHRKLKGGDLGYEDEKYSYVAFTRDPVDVCAARVLRHPQHRPGRIELQLCTPQGALQARVTKADRERYRAARKAGWGGRLE